MLWSFWRGNIDHSLKQRVMCKIAHYLRFWSLYCICLRQWLKPSYLHLELHLAYELLAYSCLVVHTFLVNVFFSSLVRSYPLWWWWCCVLPVSYLPMTPSCSKRHTHTPPPPCKPPKTTSQTNKQTTKNPTKKIWNKSKFWWTHHVLWHSLSEQFTSLTVLAIMK